MSTDKTFEKVQIYFNFNKEVTGSTKLADSVLYSNLDPMGSTNMAVEMAKIYSWAKDVFTFAPSGTNKITIKPSVLPEDSDTTYSFREGTTPGAFQFQENDDEWKPVAIHGVPTLDANGKILETYLPSYVDDVVEGYYYDGKFYTTSAHTTEIPAETGKIYVDIPSNTTYRWGGTTYVPITNPVDIMTGATSSTDGVAGLVPAPHAGDQAKFLRGDGTWATAVEASSTNGKIKINGTDTTVYAHPSHTAKTSGLYKITVDSLGHVSEATAVAKADITALGIPGQDTWVAMTAATASAAGTRGTVQPPKNSMDKYLRGDNTWVNPIDDIGILTLHCKNGTT